MPIALRSIRIIPLNPNTVSFQPDGGNRGQPLGVNTGDEITWNNTTNDPLKLQVVSITKAGQPQPVQPLQKA